LDVLTPVIVDAAIDAAGCCGLSVIAHAAKAAEGIDLVEGGFVHCQALDGSGHAFGEGQDEEEDADAVPGRLAQDANLVDFAENDLDRMAHLFPAGFSVGLAAELVVARARDRR
jgi:hypothetical protein